MSKAPRMQWSAAWQRQDGTCGEAVDTVGHELVEKLNAEMKSHGTLKLMALKPTRVRPKG